MKIRKENGQRIYELSRVEMAKLRSGWDVLDMVLELIEPDPPAKTRDQLAQLVQKYTEGLDK